MDRKQLPTLLSSCSLHSNSPPPPFSPLVTTHTHTHTQSLLNSSHLMALSEGWSMDLQQHACACEQI